jgi:hypothetical protein
MRAMPSVIAILASSLLVLIPAYGDEGHVYDGSSAFATSFFLIGGKYHLYAFARFRAHPLHKSCVFGAHFSRLLPTQDTLHMSPGVLSTIVPYKLDIPSAALPAGLYRFYVASATDCPWSFSVVSTADNVAGMSSVQLVRLDGRDSGMTDTARLNDRVRFSADIRTDHNAVVNVSGTMQILHDGQIVRTAPLQTGNALPARGDMLWADVQWNPADAKYAGRNIVRFAAKIGSEEFASMGEFTLAP